jgi:hypothetical protein
VVLRAQCVEEVSCDVLIRLDVMLVACDGSAPKVVPASRDQRIRIWTVPVSIVRPLLANFGLRRLSLAYQLPPLPCSRRSTPSTSLRYFAERFEGLLACGARRTNEATSLLVDSGCGPVARVGHGWLGKPVCRPARTRCFGWSKCEESQPCRRRFTSRCRSGGPSRRLASRPMRSCCPPRCDVMRCDVI